MPEKRFPSLSLFCQSARFAIPLHTMQCLWQRYWKMHTLLRLSLIFVLSSLVVLGSWIPLTLHVQAATTPLAPPTHTSPPASVRPAGSPLFLAASNAGSVDAVGETGFYTYVSRTVNDHLKVRVNVGNGNLVMHANDLHVQSTLLDLSIERFYNAQASTSRFTDLAPRWNLSTGADVYLQFNSDGSITFFGPSGNSALFQPNGSGGFLDPLGLNATLTKPGSYHLTFHKTGEVLVFDSSGRPTTDQDKNSTHLSFAYNGSSPQLTSITDTQGRVTHLSYNGARHLNTITDPSGRTVRYSYDSSGNLTSVTDLAGQTTTYTYGSGNGLLQTITDPAGHVIQVAYTGTQVTTLTGATGAQTSFAYSSGQTVVTDANGHKTTYQIDSGSKVTKVADALGHSRSTQYSPNDDVTLLTDAPSNTSQFQFDANNNLTSVSESTGATDSFTYQDSIHPFFPTDSTDAQGCSLAYTYDSPGNLTSVKNVTSGGAGERTSYTYNSNGTLASMTDGNGNVTTYSYDSVGNLIQVTPPSSLGTTKLQHDPLSRAISVTDGNKQVTSYTYDALDHITKITYADGSTISYTRDAAGNVTSLTDNTGTTTFTYDADNRITQKVLPGGTALTFNYDTVGNLTSFTDAGGTVHYSYNAVNLLTTLSDPSGATTGFGYDNRNLRTSVTYPNGVGISLNYDSAGHETSVIARHGNTMLSGYSYTYGTTDLRQTMTDQVTGLVSTYHYDTLNRLTEDSVTQGSSQANDFRYSYDKAGNPTSQTVNGTQTTYTYNAANELRQVQVGSAVGRNYSYDGNGNLTEIAPPNPSENTRQYAYNAKNQMVVASVGASSAVENDYTYTGPDQTELVSTSGASYVNAPFGVSSQTTSSGTTYFTRESNGSLVSERTPGATFYYLFDGLGSVVGLTDSSGNLVGNARYVYDPDGNTMSSPSATPAQQNIWRFVSGYFDSFTAFTKFGLRYDDTGVGQTMQ